MPSKKNLCECGSLKCRESKMCNKCRYSDKNKNRINNTKGYFWKGGKNKCNFCKCGKDKRFKAKTCNECMVGTSHPRFKHGQNNKYGPTKEYAAWAGMLFRCFNKKGKAYKHYGGRGITVCEEWRNSFENFFRDMGKCPDNLSLDRINNDDGYRKDNCRWATNSQQCVNQRKRKSKSGERNITIVSSGYQVDITRNYLTAHLGIFEDVEMAIIARDMFLIFINEK